MSAPSTPSIPPRPTRTQQQTTNPASLEAPKIPPRPVNRRPERSPSPYRNTFAPSPLNGGSSAHMNPGENALGWNLLHRPPSVSLPSVGQEGDEYANFSYENPIVSNKSLETSHGEPTQTRNIGTDLKLHAPKPSLPTSSATARVAPVTRTDSSQAAAAGIGRAYSQADHKDSHLRPLRPQVSFTRPESSTSTERPDSAMAGDNEQGIPEIGQQVPMYPNAGDVQAPSPSPFSQGHPTGIGYYNDGSQKAGRHHPRTRSGRTFEGPPGSYGLHGHGIPTQDKFEKAWYEKHPEALEREEHGEYGPGIGGGRGEWALSSEDLNKIVRDTASRGAGFGTSREVNGTPNEQIGYMASEEYASRMASRPQSVTYHSKAHSNSSQSHVDSPLRKASFPVDVSGKEDFDRSKDVESKRHHHENALESEAEDEDVIHVDPPSRPSNKYGGNGYDPPTEDLGPHGGNTSDEGGWLNERGYGVPILASDEVAKEEGAEFQQPAVSPKQERRGSNYFAGMDSDHPPSYQSGFHYGGSRGSSIAGSRPTSRPVSVHGISTNLSRFISHDEREELGTPLEDVDEYEPLFPDEGKEGKHLSAVGKLKRPEKRRFPSQDIWEDTPEYAQLQATVSNPQVPEDGVSAKDIDPAKAFETPEAEAARKGEVSEEDRASFLPPEGQHLAKSHIKPHLRDEMPLRPGMKQRFPSRDIWEDTPDSLRLETTVDTSQIEDARSSPDARPTTDAATDTEEQATLGKLEDNERKDATGMTPTVEKPIIPARPVRTKNADEVTKTAAHTAQPSVPARPAQRARQVPPVESSAIPSKSHTANQPQVRNVPPVWVPPTKSDEGRSEPHSTPIERKAPGLPDRPKPQVPARPAKPLARDSAEQVPLTKTTSAASASSTGSIGDETTASKGIMPPPAAQKGKPPIPARPNGGKIASLKAGFLSHLDKRLQLGPQAAKVQDKIKEAAEEENEDKAPLADARKGRARGPPRRKPVASPSGTSDEAPAQVVSKLEVAKAWTVWHTSASGDILVQSEHVTPIPLTGSETKATEEPACSPASTTLGGALRPSQVISHVHNEAPAETSSSQHDTDTISSDKDTIAASNNSSSSAKASLPQIATDTSASRGNIQDIQSSTAETTIDGTRPAMSIPTHAPTSTSMTSTAAPTGEDPFSADAVGSEPITASHEDAKATAEKADVISRE
ncbi:MAG: hypothetical protein M1835_002894 [Candelina submexicana]|nr:MAG: hypothetical protein M1835_002894 [Candelina submexicana]